MRKFTISGFFGLGGMVCAFSAFSADWLTAYHNDSGTIPGSTYAGSVVAVKCLSVTGSAGSGMTPKCFISGPGFSSYVSIGQTIGTTGPGPVQLTCFGYRRPGGTLSCEAVVDANACEVNKSLSAYNSGGGSYGETTALFSPAIATCTGASGASSGDTARCFIDAPGHYGTVDAGQTVVTTGPGTLHLGCHGPYAAHATLSCTATVEQVCP